MRNVWNILLLLINNGYLVVWFCTALSDNKRNCAPKKDRYCLYSYFFSIMYSLRSFILYIFTNIEIGFFTNIEIGFLQIQV